MKFKNIVFVVEAIEESKAFYRDLFSLQIVNDFERIYCENSRCWRYNVELYFKENNMDAL